jgi:hypothetical protein
MSGPLLDDGTSVLGSVAGAGGDAFDPSEHNIDEVKEHVGDSRHRAKTVLNAEREGDARVTLIAWLEEQIAAEPEPRPEPVEAEAVPDHDREALREQAASKPVGPSDEDILG